MNSPNTPEEESGGGTLAELARLTSLREGPEGVARILRKVYGEGAISLKDLSRQTGIPIPVLSAVRRELERAKFAERRGGGVALTEKGVQFVEGQLKVRTSSDVTCQTCRGRRVVIPPEFLPALEKLTHYFEQRPAVDVTLDQTPALPESSIRRALYMYQSGALEGKSVLFVGDDDSVSLAVALVGRALGREDFCERLTVVEADERIIDFITRVSRAESFTIECVRHDLRDPLPAELRQRFDTFETDPPYTPAGLRLFVSRAVSALKPGVGRQGFLSFGPKSPDEALAIHRGVAEMALVSNEVIPFFNEYQGASIIGGSSQLIHLLTTSATAPAVPESRYDDAIYTGEGAPTTRLYRCASCQTVVKVGQGHRFTTIESLKESGCPKCGNGQFRYQGRSEESAQKPETEESTRRPETSAGEIRRATPADLADIVNFEIEIARISFPEDAITEPEVHRRKLTKAMGEDSEGMFVMAAEGRVVGWAWVTINSNFLSKQTYGNLRSLAVHPDWRRKGAGRELLERGLDYCRQRQALWMVTKVHADNLPMKNLCLGLGFNSKHLTMELRFPPARAD